jgi:pimeloyl-ACP methyl ester carboxylesterase
MLATAPDGAQISYHDYNFSDPWKPTETLLLHHGLRSNGRTWDAWIPLLARKYRTVVIDARGRGESTVPPPGFNWSLEQFATDALAVADAVGVDRFHWLGTSFGAAIGEYVAARYGQRLKTLVLTSPPYRFDHLKDVVDEWIADYARIGGQAFVRQDVPKMFPADTDPGMLEFQIQQMAAIPDYIATDMLRFMETVNNADLLADIKVPTLILAAKKSDRAPSTEADFMKTRIPNCDLVVFDSHHNITMTMPEKCAEVVLEFLARHTEQLGAGAPAHARKG